MKKLLAVAVCFVPGLAWGQAAVLQNGPVTKNSPVMWAQDHTIRQGAGAAGDVSGKMITGGFSAVGNVCSYSNTTDQSGIGLCLDATNGRLVYNGTGYPISGGGGNVVGPGSSTSAEIPGWNNTSGTLLKSSGSRAVTGSNQAWLFDPDQTKQLFVKWTGAVSATQDNILTDTNNTALMWFKQSGAIVGRGVNTGTALAEFNMRDTGTLNNNDSYVGVAGDASLTVTRSGAGQTNAVGMAASAHAYAPQGGVLPGSPKGELHGLNVVTDMSSALGTPPTGFASNQGIEVDIAGCSTCTTQFRMGMMVIDFGDGAGGSYVQGSSLDTAYLVGARAGSVGWKNAFYLTSNITITGGGFPLSNDGCIICTDAINAGKGIDLSGVTLSSSANNIFAGPGNLFFVTGAGNVQGAAITATGGMIVNTAIGSNAHTDYRTSGTSNWVVGREATTQDFIIKNNVTADVLYRINASTGALSQASAGNFSIAPASTKAFSITTAGAGGTLSLTTGAGAMTLTTGAGNLAIVLGGGNQTITGLPAVAAGTGKRFLCIDTATKIVYEGSGASCN